MTSGLHLDVHFVIFTNCAFPLPITIDHFVCKTVSQILILYIYFSNVFLNAQFAD